MSNLINKRSFKHYLVYETTNVINGKKYIGCHATDNLDDGYIGSGKLLRRAIKRYGKKSFKCIILYSVATAEEMFKIEAALVTEDFVNSESTYNLVPGGSGGFKVQDIDEWKSKLKSSRIGRTPFKGFNHTSESKLKISLASKGRQPWNVGVEGTFKGKTHSAESKEKMSQANRGKYKGKNNPMYGKSAVKGRKWYHNGQESFYLFPDDSRVSSLIIGRLPKVNE